MFDGAWIRSMNRSMNRTFDGAWIRSMNRSMNRTTAAVIAVVAVVAFLVGVLLA